MVRLASTIAGTCVAALVLSGCAGRSALGSDDSAGPTYLTASTIYLQEGDHEAAANRIEELRDAIAEIRGATHSGWIGRQDDVTGYLGELMGGTFKAREGERPAAALARLMDTHGPKLFGIDSSDLKFGPTLTTPGVDAAAIRATQRFHGLQVLDGSLVFGLARPGGHLLSTSARGRVFPRINVETRPAIGAARAVQIAERDADSTTASTPNLVIVPDGVGILAWQVHLIDTGGAITVPGGAVDYFVDAASGKVVEVRSVAANAQPTQTSTARTASYGRLKAAPIGSSVTVTGVDPQGRPLSAIGMQAADGVHLQDNTVPTYDPTTDEGSIVTYTAQDQPELSKSVPYVERDTSVRDPEAMAAHAFSRKVYDYLARLGWKSWDNKGSTLVSVVNSEWEPVRCNAMFLESFMLYGNPCRSPYGNAEMVEIDTAGHEITHGVTASSAGLVYSGQSGALNEAFSDYFGNVIGNRTKGKDDSAFSEDACVALSRPVPEIACGSSRDGVIATRELLNGTKFEDYLRLLSLPSRLRGVVPGAQDEGGVHLNSAIWNNALWTIRTRLARVDGTTMLKSALVKKFDAAVFHALTRRLGPTSGFVDAGNAVVESAGSDATVRAIARRTLDANGICAACSNAGLHGAPVAPGTATQVAPAVNDDKVVWIERVGNGSTPHGLDVSGAPRTLAHTASTVDVVFAGSAVVALEERDNGSYVLVHYPRLGRSKRISEVGKSTMLAGLGGSNEGAAWAVSETGTIYFISKRGRISTTRPNEIQGHTVTAVGTGKGVVGFGTDDGRVFTWTPGKDAVQVGKLDSDIRVAATYGKHILAIDDNRTARLFDSAARTTTDLSSSASIFGGAVNEHGAVWANNIGRLHGRVEDLFSYGSSDTDLYRFAFGTHITSRMKQRGQQGFPALSGNRLVWQESGLGGDTIFSARITGH